MQLGTLISRLESDCDATAALVALGDLPLYAAVLSMADQFGESPGDYVVGAAGRFASQAGDQDWLALATASERAADPGKAALGVLVRWALERDRMETEEARATGCACRTSPENNPTSL